jgi:CRISPR-associated endonuclease/helicase Cas3
MSAPNFTEFYRIVNGHPPFPWQERLSARVLNDRWPDAIDVPTGCGKTSVLDVAVYALAMQADSPVGARSPLRIFFVVDRRLVVDDVSKHARRLQECLEQPALSEVKERLKSFGCARPLDVSVMRGGMYRSDSWADAPNQPVVCVSTVDQVGSRLLFRGYGVSDNARPVHAGLVGNDSLVIVDEAHLSQPFAETLRAVQRYQTGQEIPGLRFVEMSATRRHSEGTVESLDESDFENEVLQRRLDAPKIAELKETGQLAADAAATALRFARPDTGVVGVVLNTVATARATFEILRTKASQQCILLTGRIRPYDRDRLLDQYSGHMKANREPRDGERLFVVATQTIEVGADLDFDALITESAPLDSLRQRFGRLNRLGKGPEARAAILRPNRAKESEAIYGVALEKTWAWLRKHGGEQIDFGVRAMQSLYEAEGDETLLTEKKEAPVLLPAYLDAWAQTNPAPVADPDVTPFLHGVGSQTSADVQIVWRADLDDVEDPWNWREQITLAPPVSREALPVPIGAAKRWLQYQTAGVADVEGAPAIEDERPTKERPFLIWRGPDESRTELWRLRPGDTVIVRSAEGGCDQFGWSPASNGPVRDIGDLCANERVGQSGGRYRVRIVPQVLFPDEADGRAKVEEYLRQWEEDGEEKIEQQLLDAAKYGAKAARLKAYGARWLLMESAWFRRPKGLLEVAPDETDEDDQSASITSLVTLREHTEGVAAKALSFATRCGLHGAAAEAIKVAARLHDQGKQDERFQYMLSLRATPEPLAKSADVSVAEWRRRQADSGFPKGARHEFASVALAASLDGWPGDCDADLALYLIGTHHGFGRPFPPIWDDSGHNIRATIDGQPLEVTRVHEISRVDSGWVDRFWTLTRKYGWWGLSYSEAILRRADCVRSREERRES